MRKHFFVTSMAACLAACSATLSGQALLEHSPEYHLQRSDSVTVTYRYTPEFDQTVTVGPDGRAALSGFGTFVADGLTVDEFRQQVLKLSTQRLVDPVIAVTLKDFEKPHIYVEGEVNTPGRVELHGNVSALDAIALAGGFKPSSSSSNVLLLRTEVGRGGKTRVMDLKRLIDDRKLEEVPQLRSGDVVYVTQNTLSKVERLVHMGNFGAIYNPLR